MGLCHYWCWGWVFFILWKVGAAGGLSALCAAFFAATSGAVTSELTKAYKENVPTNAATDLRQQGITAILLIALVNGMTSASDYEEYQKTKPAENATSSQQTPSQNNY